MTVNLFLVPFLHAENDLRGYNVALVGILEVQIRVNCKRRRVLKYVCGNRLVVNNVTHVPTRLIHAKKGQTVEDAWVYFPATVGDDAHNHLYAKVSKGINIHV